MGHSGWPRGATPGHPRPRSTALPPGRGGWRGRLCAGPGPEGRPPSQSAIRQHSDASLQAPQPARCGRGVAARYAQAQGTAPSSRQDVDPGAETAPAAAEDRLRLLTFWARPPRSCARARPCCPAARRTEPDRFACESAGAARRPGCARPPGGHRPSSPSRTWLASSARGHPSRPSCAARPQRDVHAQNRYPEKNECGAIGYQASGSCPRGNTPREG